MPVAFRNCKAGLGMGLIRKALTEARRFGSETEALWGAGRRDFDHHPYAERNQRKDGRRRACGSRECG